MPWYPSETIQDAEAALTGENGRPLMELMRALSLWDDPPEGAVSAGDVARELGWIDRAGALSDLGWRVASPLREFLFWEERERRLHPAFREIPWLEASRFEGRSVLEVGSGFGCNLFSLTEPADSVFGVDVEPIVLQFTPILARLAGVPEPPVGIGSAEHLPLGDESFDVVMSFGSIQYMRIREAIREATRVLRPGGFFLFTTSTVDQFLKTAASQGRKLLNPRFAYLQMKALWAVLSYQYLGRRVGVRSVEEVWASEGFTRRWIQQAGLRVADVYRTDDEICYVTEKVES